MIKSNTENYNKDKKTHSFFQEKFEHSQESLSFSDTQKIRSKVIEFLDQYSIPKEIIDNINLSITEILSNLVKHPTKSLSFLKISIRNIQNKIELDITDNSTPFEDFDIEITKALKALKITVDETKGGYGLGLIARINQDIKYTSSNDSDDNLNHFTSSQTIDIPDNKEIEDHTPPLAPKNKQLLFIIDDDATARKLYTKILKDKYKVMSFEHAEDALKAFPDQKPKLIISDLIMPDMDGINLRKKLSELEGGDTTPFIFISADSDKEDSIYIDDLGVDDFLCKPVRAEKLLHVVFRLLKRSLQIQESLQKKFDDDITQLLEPAVPKSYKNYNIKLAYAVAEAGGGDFVSYKETDNKLTIVLADVMGHGKKAKFFSYMYAGYLNSIFNVNAKDHNAAEILQELSQYINNDRLLEDVILTCQCTQLFPDGKVDIASAGHPYPIIIKNKTNTVEPVHIKGALPGLTDNNIYNLISLHLEQGDKLIFMTDGFLETFSKTENALQDVIDLINENIQLHTPELLSTIWEVYEEKTKDPSAIKDDATLIIMEYNNQL